MAKSKALQSTALKAGSNFVIAAICIAAIAFVLGVFAGSQIVLNRLQHFADAHARNETFEDEYPNHNIPRRPGMPLIVVVGDSISTSHYRPHSADGEYPYVLAKRMHAALLNLSVPGWETDAMIAHAVPLIPSNSDVVIYEGGTNDLIYTGLQALPRVADVTAAVRARAPHAKIVVVGLREFRESLKAGIRAWNAREEALAEARGITYVNIGDAFPAADRAEWPDGVHPNRKGAERLATIVLERVAK